jgi:hypothetical protein
VKLVDKLTTFIICTYNTTLQNKSEQCYGQNNIIIYTPKENTRILRNMISLQYHNMLYNIKVLSAINIWLRYINKHNIGTYVKKEK